MTIPLAPAAGSERLEALYEELADPALERWQRVEREILSAWTRSGSPAMDLLLLRGTRALADGDTEAAIEHLTALTDHAPDFAEGWNQRATAYYRTGLYGPALADIQRALALNPRHFGAFTGLGLILEEIGYLTEAFEALKAAHAIHPHQPGIRRARERLEQQVAGRAL